MADNHSDNNHSDNNHSDNNHSDNNHSDNNHSDDESSTTILTNIVSISETSSIVPLPVNLIQSDLSASSLIIQPLNPNNGTVQLSLNQLLTGKGYVVTNQQGQAPDGTEITKSTFVTTNPEVHAPNISESLTETVTQYYDDESSGESSILMNQIKGYAAQIKCSDFHGKGTIDDYNELFVAAAKIANESKQMQLNVDIDGFAEFGQAADDLSDLFNSFIIKLQKVSIIDDTNFLRIVATALGKIVNLSEIFGRFKETILATSTVNVPKSSHDTSILLTGIMSEVNCALNYINHFVNPSNNEKLPDADLSSADKTIINTAVSTIEHWNVLCDQGVIIAMSNNPDIKNIGQINNELKVKTDAIKNSTNMLKAKFAHFNISY